LLRSSEYYGNTVTVTILGGLFNQNLPTIGNLIVFYVISFLATSFAFAINDIEDAEDDAKDPAKVNRNPISARRLKPAQAKIFTCAIAIVTVLLVLPYGSAAILVTVLDLVLGFLYSSKLVRLKSMPVVDLLSHGMFLGGLQFLLPAVAGNSPLTMLTVFGTLGVFGVSFCGDLKNEIRDYVVDRKTNIRNTASLINVRAIGPYLEYLYILPITALIFVLAQKLPESRRLLLMGAGLIFAGIFVMMPKKIRDQIVNVYNQAAIILAGIGAYLAFYPW
jgi:4-hydroxybenzoate polyprenyltransferase